MARKRFEETLVIHSWDDVDQALKEIAENEIMIEEIEGNMNKDIHAIKEQSGAMAKPHKERIKELERLVKKYVSVNKKDIVGKTMTLNFGSTGYRASTSVSIPRGKDVQELIIERLKKNGMDDCVNVIESINKDVLKKYDEDKIIRVGAKLKKQDTFWYEVLRDKIK